MGKDRKGKGKVMALKIKPEKRHMVVNTKPVTNIGSSFAGQNRKIVGVPAVVPKGGFNANIGKIKIADRVQAYKPTADGKVLASKRTPK